VNASLLLPRSTILRLPKLSLPAWMLFNQRAEPLPPPRRTRRLGRIDPGFPTAQEYIFDEILDECTYLLQSSATSNFNNSAAPYVGEDNTTSISFVGRIIARSAFTGIPTSGLTVTSAKLKLRVDADFATNARTLSVYRILRTVNFGQTTWNVYSTGNNWGTAGCSNTTTDREASAIGTATQPASPAQYDWIEASLDPAAVQEMIETGVGNNSLLVRVDTEVNDCIRYFGIGAALADNRPRMEVVYVA
jgi:hypothetical protein